MRFNYYTIRETPFSISFESAGSCSCLSFNEYPHEIFPKLKKQTSFEDGGSSWLKNVYHAIALPTCIPLIDVRAHVVCDQYKHNTHGFDVVMAIIPCE